MNVEWARVLALIRRVGFPIYYFLKFEYIEPIDNLQIITMEQKITERIKFEIGDFADRCLAIYKENIDAGIKKTYDEMYNRIQSQIKSQIMQTIGGRDMYTNEGILYPDPKKAIKTISEFNYSQNNGHGEWFEQERKRFEEAKTGFKSLKEDEKIIIAMTSTAQQPGGYSEKRKIFITNHARYLAIQSRPPQATFQYKYEMFAYRIPNDYIRILKAFTTLLEDTILNIEPVLLNILGMIKDQLYDRKIVPLYTQEIMEENKELKEKYEQYEKDRKELDQEKSEFEIKRTHFEEYIKPYTDLEKEKEELLAERQRLHDEREKLRLIAKKIQMEREKLEREKEIIDKIDIANI